MRKTTNRSAFTLVELIVVITILAVLGTIGFMSLQGYSADARNTKRTTDLNSFQSSISVKMAEGGGIMAFVTPVAERKLTDATAQLAGADATASNYDAGKPNYTALGVKEAEFQDPNGQDYAIAATTTAGGRLEVAASVEVDGAKKALIKGTYYKRTDSAKTFQSVSGKVITLDAKDTNAFSSGDTVKVTGGAADQTLVIKKVARDGVTLTFDTPINTDHTSIALASNEVEGLINDRETTENIVTDGGTALPY